jgi:hypothetical protein
MRSSCTEAKVSGQFRVLHSADSKPSINVRQPHLLHDEIIVTDYHGAAIFKMN